MKSMPRSAGIDHEGAQRWLRYSLGQGDVIAPAVLGMLFQRRGHAYALVPGDVDPARLAKPGEGGVMGAQSAAACLSEVLKSLAARGAACVVVEDEARRRHDPNPTLDGTLHTAYAGDLPIHWSVMSGDMADAALVLQRGSGGYPLNGFVVTASERDLGLADAADLGQDLPNVVARSLVAVIVAAYDAETFMIWEAE